jgi:uracil-DNA glycosylase
MEPGTSQRRTGTLLAADAASGTRSLRVLAAEAQTCTRCDLYREATQTVFGRGSERATVVLVGEAPGDVEDREGEPFVGPAGRLLQGVLDDLGVDRRALYVTNAVKHFKWTARGKRRIHQKPNAAEIVACHAWLDAELALVEPRVVVAMGATAARSVLGHPVTIAKARGSVIEEPDGGPAVVVTIHPSAILRAKGTDRDELAAGLRDDLRLAVRHASEPDRVGARSAGAHR